jgi:ABC-type nitrate/sulfonate/bicarbonate transport system permease component
MTLRRLALMLGSLLTTCLLVYAWQLTADARLVSPVFLPSPVRTWQALIALAERGELGAKTLATVERMIYGWILASLVGVGLGSLIGISRWARTYIAPTLEFMRPLPASAIVPVAIAFLGLSDTMVLSVIAFGALWPMLLSTVHGFGAVEPRLYEVSAALGMSRTEVIRKIALPSALPDIIASMRLGLTVALILSVVGEMLASREGLGQIILAAARSFRSHELFAGIIMLGAIGLISNYALSGLEHQLLRWKFAART